MYPIRDELITRARETREQGVPLFVTAVWLTISNPSRLSADTLSSGQSRGSRVKRSEPLATERAGAIGGYDRRSFMIPRGGGSEYLVGERAVFTVRANEMTMNATERTFMAKRPYSPVLRDGPTKIDPKLLAIFFHGRR